MELKIIETLFPGITFYKKDIPEDHKWRYYIGMGDGVGTCLECGRGNVYDMKKVQSPLVIYGGKNVRDKNN